MLASSFFVLACVAYVKGAPGERPPFCLKPPNLGLCRPINQSWYFDVKTRRCFMLPSGQCWVGSHIFTTEQMCMTSCAQPKGRPLPSCLQKPRVVSCEPNETAWFYHPKHKGCKMFRHGSCGRGLNHFATELKCEAECGLRKNPVPVCSAKPESAYCVGWKTHWYFDQSANNCSHFEGWWCGKNANGFVSYNVCMWRCSYKPRPNPPPQRLQNKPAQLPNLQKSGVQVSNNIPGRSLNQLARN